MYVHTDNAPALGRSTFSVPDLIPSYISVHTYGYKNLIKSATTDTITTDHLADADVENSPNEKLNVTEGKGPKSYS